MKNNLEERFIELRNENSKYSIKVLELEQELAQVRKESELLKHEYREKLGYLVSNKWTSKTLVSIEMERLENERIRDRFSYEKSILVQELQKTREQLDKAEKVIEFYEKENHWLGLTDKVPFDVLKWIRIVEDDMDENNLGGIRARQYFQDKENKDEK